MSSLITFLSFFFPVWYILDWVMLISSTNSRVLLRGLLSTNSLKVSSSRF